MADFRGTRILVGRAGGEVLAVRRAYVRVVRGSDLGKEVQLGERTEAVVGTDPDVDLVLTDDSVSRRHATVRAEASGYVVQDLDSTNGLRVHGVRVRDVVCDGRPVVVSLGETDLEISVSSDEVQRELSPHHQFGLLIGRAPAMRGMFTLLERAAATDSTVLLEGESGTGKEVIAQSIHRASPRAAGPLVVVDCSAIPPSLIESELFGHEKGAFTGAVATRPGAIEEASGGTLFLDEIGELPLELQPKFLRALERRQVKHVGSAQYRDVDVRVIAATNRDLSRLVADNKFRSDLFYRLAVVQVAVPPLRQHLEDVPLLANHFVRQLRPGADPASFLSHAVLSAFSRYSWPGNVRELRNAVERLLALGELAAPVSDVRVGAAAESPPPPSADDDYHQARRSAIEHFEREYCSAILRACDGVVVRAAERAHISRQMFHRLLQKHGIQSD